MNTIAIFFDRLFEAILALFGPHLPPEVPVNSPIEPAVVPQDVPVPPEPTIAPPPPPKYLWDTPSNVRHSVRVICDEEGLTLEQKNTLCATIACESGFNIHARHHNVSKSGKLLSTDFGLAQWNDFYHGS